MKALLRALPDLARLLARLVSDPVIPRSVKIALAAAALYLANPFDLIPDFIPVLGYLDDVLVAAVVLDGLLSYVDRGLLLRYWPGSEASLDKLSRAARFFAAWVPARIKARIFSPRS
jgi:uncharacterized membrane protein YkvA (DUF1232 family)